MVEIFSILEIKNNKFKNCDYETISKSIKISKENNLKNSTIILAKNSNEIDNELEHFHLEKVHIFNYKDEQEYNSKFKKEIILEIILKIIVWIQEVHKLLLFDINFKF